MNNPLSYTDPSGYFSLKKLFRAVVAIAVGYFTGQWIGNLFQGSALASGAGTAFANVGYAGSASAAAGGLTSLGSALAGAAGGFAGGLVGSGSLKGAINGAFSGGVFGAIGGLGAEGGWSTGQYVAAHAAGGCITSVAGGGQCGSGALSAAFGKFATIQTQDWGVGVAQFTASTIAGGIGSVLGGGKFENGAVTAAFGYLFNQGMSTLKRAMFSTSPIDNSDQNMKATEESLRTNAQAVAQGSVEAAKTGAAICGLANPACRAVDVGFSVMDSTIAASKGDWSVAAGNAVGFGVGKWAAESMSALKFYSQQVTQGVGHAYDKITGKVAEYIIQQSQKPQK